MPEVILIRHGESLWNKENRFTGWTDVDLSEQGIQEAHQAGKLLQESGYTFDVAYTSVLKRAIRTLWIILSEMDLMWIPIHNSWQLNERHYGALQGLNKAETAAEHGEEQVHIWRRSYDICPPSLDRSDKRFPGHDPRYSELSQDILPVTESLKTTVERVIPYWGEVIAPEIKAGKRVIISAHGNSLRALVKYFDGISDKEITELNIPTGIPLLYHLDENLKPISHEYLGDPQVVDNAVNSVKHQGKAN